MRKVSKCRRGYTALKKWRHRVLERGKRRLEGDTGETVKQYEGQDSWSTKICGTRGDNHWKALSGRALNVRLSSMGFILYVSRCYQMILSREVTWSYLVLGTTTWAAVWRLVLKGIRLKSRTDQLGGTFSNPWQHEWGPIWWHGSETRKWIQDILRR